MFVSSTPLNRLPVRERTKARCCKINIFTSKRSDKGPSRIAGQHLFHYFFLYSGYTSATVAGVATSFMENMIPLRSFHLNKTCSQNN